MLEEVIRRLREDHKAHFGSRKVPRIVVTDTINHANSRIARLNVRWDSEERWFFVKLLYPDREDGRTNRSDRPYKEQQVHDEYEVLDKLHKSFPSNHNLGVIKPVACFPDCLALVTEEQSGLKFSTFFKSARVYSREKQFNELVGLTRACGHWLRCFQEFMHGESRTLTYDFQELFNYCEVRLERLSRSRPHEFTKELCKAILDFVKHTIYEVNPLKLQIVGRHNDFTPNNMIVSGRRLIVLDFAGFSYGPICCDYVKFWSGLDSIVGSPLVSSAAVEELKNAFVGGYGVAMDFNDPLVAVFRVAWILDRIDDIWLEEWPSLGVLRRLVYVRLHKRYLCVLRDYLQTVDR
jgi:thiamine kinase-like enzyme